MCCIIHWPLSPISQTCISRALRGKGKDTLIIILADNHCCKTALTHAQCSCKQRSPFWLLATWSYLPLLETQDGNKHSFFLCVIDHCFPGKEHFTKELCEPSSEGCNNSVCTDSSPEHVYPMQGTGIDADLSILGHGTAWVKSRMPLFHDQKFSNFPAVF